MPLTRTSLNKNIAEGRAAEVSAGRRRLDAGREALSHYRAEELAEAEALSLARIKADTERALAHQAQALRDAERAAELVAIERRSVDLDVIREAQRRLRLEVEAKVAATARANATVLATTAALERKSALAAKREAYLARVAAQRTALSARRTLRRTRIRLFWLSLCSASPIVVGMVAILVGCSAGYLSSHTGDNMDQIASAGEAVRLRLDYSLATLPAAVEQGNSH